MVLLSYESHRSVNPLWWRLPVWTALTVVSVLSTKHVDHRIAGGIVMGFGVVLIQFIGAKNVSVRRAVVLLSGTAGLAATLILPGGIAEVLAIIPIGRVPRAFTGRVLITLVVIDTIAFGVVVAIISHSVAGALAGTAIPFIVQREIEHQELMRERDRAKALLAEVQAGQEAEMQAAALRERGRIAREMHDVLAHSLAGLSVQLQAVRAIAAREKVGDTLLAPIDKAAQLARDGLTEARAAVSTLRDPIGLGLGELPALIQRHPGRAALVIDGQPGQVGPAAGHAIYRAVQEALTNAVRYAPGATVAVRLVWSVTELTVTVRDSGPAPGRSAVGGQGTGLGLAGMDERVRQVDGTLHSGPHPDGGWLVEISVPTTGDDT